MHARQKRSNYILLGDWAKCEGGTACNNPLNTTEPEPGTTNYNPQGVKNYPTGKEGIEATFQTLTNGDYPGIVRGLKLALPPVDIVKNNSREFDLWGTGTGCILRELT